MQGKPGEIVHEERFATDETRMDWHAISRMPWTKLENRLLDIVRSRSS